MKDISALSIRFSVASILIKEYLEGDWYCSLIGWKIETLFLDLPRLLMPLYRDIIFSKDERSSKNK
jgi:hypothetical protein